MLTPQEVSEVRFNKAMFGGYDMGGVDDFLDRLTEDYGSLYKENAALKAKLKVLAGTVEEYRSVDEEMRRALASAKRAAVELVDEARRESETMMAAARAESGELRARLEEEAAGETRKLQAVKKESEAFVGRLKGILTEQVKQLEAFAGSPAPPPEREGRVSDFAAEVAKSVAGRLREEDAAPASADPPGLDPQNAEDPPGSGRREALDYGSGTRIFTLTEDGLRPVEDGDGRIPGEEPEEDTVVPPPKEEFPDLRFGKGG